MYCGYNWKVNIISFIVLLRIITFSEVKLLNGLNTEPKPLIAGPLP